MIELADSLAAVGDAAGVEPPTALRAKVLTRALEIRPATVVPPCTPVEAYLAAAATLRPLLIGGDARIAGHVLGVEQLVAHWVAGVATDAVDHADVHVPFDLDAWDGLVARVAELAGADPRRPVTAYGLPTDAEGLLVLRTFELWTHAQDLGGSVPVAPPAQLSLMSARLAEVVPLAMAARGVARPGRTARLVLTGVAPGCFDVALDPAGTPGEPDVTILVDVVDVCRVAARRADPTAIPVHFEGDDELGRLVLAAADAFAQD